MTKVKRLYQWVFTHEKEYSLIMATMIVLMDAYLIIEWRFLWIEGSSNIAIITRIMAGVGTALYVVSEIMLLKRAKFENFLQSISSEMETLYFHGFKLKRYFISSDAILRLQRWCGSGMCYELSVLAMILMKNHKSARLCRGDYYDENGNFRTRHAWVEVKIPLNGWVVVDFAWTFPGFSKKNYYFRHINNPGKLVCKWVCSYKEFWDVQFSNVVREAMQNKKTSCVLLELSGFGNPDNGYEFSEWVFDAKELKYSDGSVMIPFRRGDSDELISNRIIRDFVKNPKRKNPKAKSIRLAKIARHKYEIWAAQQVV